MITLTVLVVAGCHGPGPEEQTPPSQQTAPTVRSIQPEPGAVGVPIDAAVVVRFSEPVRTDTGTAAFSDGREAQVTFNAGGDELTLVPTAPFGSLIDVEVELSGFQSAGGVAMEEPFHSAFQTELLDRMDPRPISTTPGRDWAFVDVATEAGIAVRHQFSQQVTFRPTVSAGAGTGDYDGDGFVDLYIGRGDVGPTYLFRNRGDGTFEDVTDAAGVLVTDASVASPIFVDYDADTDLDLLVPRFDIGSTHLFRNEGDGTFVDVPDAGGLPLNDRVFSAAFGDFDQDLDLDVFFARFGVPDTLDPRFLYRNEGDGTFTDATSDAWLFFLDIQQSFTPNFADMNDDGWPELLIACDHRHSVYLRAQGDGTYLVDQAVDLTDENGMGATVADFDNDGDLDWFVSAIYDPNGYSEENFWGVLGNRLYDNQGDGHLVDISEQAGVRDGAWGWGSCAADLDLDGHVDIFHVNGWMELSSDDTAIHEEYFKDRSRLFRNLGDGTFSEISLELQLHDTSQGRGLACFDYDRDGDIDLLVSPWEGQVRLLRNDSERHGHFLNVRLEGRAPNTEGVGARVYVTTGAMQQMRELRLGSNFGSNDPVEAHFGLGDVQVVDELRVRWPDGTESVARDVPADRFVKVSQL